MVRFQLCAGLNCPIKRKCYRALAGKGEVNYYFTELPYDFEIGECEFYYKAKFR